MKLPFEIIDLWTVWPMVTLFLVSLVPVAAKVMNRNEEPNVFFSLFIPVIGSLFAALISLASFGMRYLPEMNRSLFSNSMVIDGVSSWIGALVGFILCFVLMMSREHASVRRGQFSEFVFLILNCAVGMLLVASSNDLILTFVGIEVMSLTLYLIIALSREETLSKEAALKYFVLGSFASAIFLYGISFIYGAVGSTYLTDISQVASDLISTNRIFLVGCTLLIIGIGFKVSVFPFHMWTPDVYQGSPTPVTSFMATAVKVVTFTAFLRFVFTDPLIGERSVDLVNLMQWLALLTMFAGNIAAIQQDNLKRMLAYSSVAHSGYLIVGVIAAGLEGSEVLGASGVLFYLFSYSLMTLGTFAFVGLFEKSQDSQVSIDSLKGLAKTNPWFAGLFTILLLSLAGIPPTIGFFGKFFIFSSAIQQGLFWLAIWGVVNSVISVYYYLRPVVYMYMSESESPSSGLLNMRNTQFTIWVTAILVVVIGLFSNPFYKMMSSSILAWM